MTGQLAFGGMPTLRGRRPYEEGFCLGVWPLDPDSTQPCDRPFSDTLFGDACDGAALYAVGVRRPDGGAYHLFCCEPCSLFFVAERVSAGRAVSPDQPAVKWREAVA